MSRVALGVWHPSNPIYPVWIPHASVKPSTAISHLYFVEAVRTLGPAWLRNAEERQRGETEGEAESWTNWLGKAILSWAWLGYLDWAGYGLGCVALKLLLVWCSTSLPGYSHPFHTCTCRSEQRKVRVSAAHNPEWMLRLQSQVGLVSQSFAVSCHNIKIPPK